MSFPCWLEEDEAVFDTGDDYAPAPLADLSAAARDEYWATLALRHCRGLGARYLLRLLRGFGSAYTACQRSEQWAQFVPGTLATEFQSGKWRNVATQEWRKAQNSPALILLWKSSLYPRLLRQIPDAPALLYLGGDFTLLQGPMVAVVGSREPSSQGIRVAASISRDLSAAGVTVVSGLALGIDRAAHGGSLPEAGRSVGVLGTGVDIIYPRANKDLFSAMAQNGLLLSEFPLGTPPNAVNFPIRNRVISGLSLGVLVVEAAAKSGSLVTAAQALEQNREVFAIAGAPLENHSLGCQNLIRQGARPVFNAEDVLRDLQLDLRQFCPTPPPLPSQPMRPPLLQHPLDFAQEKPKPMPPSCVEARALLSTDAASLALDALREHGVMQIDAIAERTGLSPSQLASALLGLELTCQIELLPGSFYKVI